MPVPAPVVDLSPTLLKQLAFDRLQEAILAGQLHPGERLFDAGLQSWLGVSRAPLRQAIEQLALVGLLEVRPNRYTKVATRSVGEALDALRALREFARSVLATSGVSRCSCAVLDQLQLAGRALSREGITGAFWARFVEGLTTLARETANPFVCLTLETFGPTLEYKLAALGDPTDIATMGVSLSEFVRALQGGKALPAAGAMERLFAAATPTSRNVGGSG
ncbi:MAG: GntR family transcriptional regulator [Leifsonia sp.]